ncbi:hypothetical protein AAHA92_09720 [Salvia divinorum]|uniref:Secreted protein n=1 Tax=Salvia divinorum TaxID=28513 RepID=A0ABD1HSH3_SALDI
MGIDHIARIITQSLLSLTVAAQPRCRRPLTSRAAALLLLPSLLAARFRSNGKPSLARDAAFTDADIEITEERNGIGSARRGDRVGHKGHEIGLPGCPACV